MTRSWLWAQGLYYLLTGAWPFVSMRTFEAVTGPKTDRWLVRTVGALAAVIGAVLLFAGMKRYPSAEAKLLALTSAGAFGIVDTAYASRGRIAKVYLLDAVAEAGLLAAGSAAVRHQS